MAVVVGRPIAACLVMRTYTQYFFDAGVLLTHCSPAILNEGGPLGEGGSGHLRFAGVAVDQGAQRLVDGDDFVESNSASVAGLEAVRAALGVSQHQCVCCVGEAERGFGLSTGGRELFALWAEAAYQSLCNGAD